ncbi:Gfo/Idh/MocA family protein [Nocardia brasiliensis]|uniref:Oxidoreductase domain-containing protein n=1 Tax=Nocardia brasiliensis (strain ATCC 700358 / HUJEG-1) TaxID=1133849 RepID=K0EG23_NOCB7|nr:Gfo/Idh/MocA family oxidoreductase [Nocardia brasiliensis]AFT98162.1 oxidoreductase domain-containing protein [Nocardia brasiliensis ATCC 700358]OCF90835.1 oxidoreductase [Nocardia brasiliensis]
MVNNSRIRLGIIGLGVMGTEMLEVAHRHPEFDVVAAADPDAAAVERVRAQYPDLAVGHDPEALVRDDRLAAIYIAAPPNTHASYAISAMNAGKAVFSEKPLAARLADGADMVRVAAETGAVNALNFTLSDRAAAVAVMRAVHDGEAGEIVAVDMRFTFPEWPRAFQRDARWVAGREQGGLLREVGSHFLFLTDRLLGPLTPAHTRIAYGADAELSAHGLYTAGAVPVTITGLVAAAPETYEWILYGTKRSYRITDWSHLEVSTGTAWQERPLDGPRGTEHTRLTAFAAAIRGEASTLADFAAGLRVQEAVEHFHRA